MEINYLPLELLEDDKLSFASKAQEIASSINDFPSFLPYSIGVRGPWGSGKSTMLNFIEQYLDSDKCSVIRFNPWIETNRESLINSLFEEIYYEIDGGYTKTKQKFAEYAQKIIPPATKIATYFGAMSNGADPRTASTLSSGAGETVKGIGELLFDKPLSKRKKELHDEMYRTYSDTDKKIVVMIDELDRLFPEEIITIFQMMKSSLDFPGLVFVVAMDEIMVYEALEKKGINRSKDYLDKIFQRNYYINFKNQLRTLTDHFLISHLDNTYNPDKLLKECLEAYIYLEEEKLVSTSIDNISRVKIAGGESWDLMPMDASKIRSSYFKIYRMLNDELNLTNPRTFLNFSNVIREIWSRCFEQGIQEDSTDTYRLHTSFLIIVAYIWYPTECEPSTFNRNSAKEISQPFLKAVKEHLNLIIPEYRKDNPNNKYSKSILDYNDGIKDMTMFLNPYPDYIRYNRLQREFQNNS